MTKIGVEQADKDAGEHPDQILPDSFSFQTCCSPTATFPYFWMTGDVLQISVPAERQGRIFNRTITLQSMLFLPESASLLHNEIISAILPVVLTILFFTMYWLVASSRRLKAKLYGAYEPLRANSLHVVLKRSAGFVLLGVLPVAVMVLLNDNFTLAGAGVRFNPETTRFTVISIILLSLLVIPIAFSVPGSRMFIQFTLKFGQSAGRLVSCLPSHLHGLYISWAMRRFSVVFCSSALSVPQVLLQQL